MAIKARISRRRWEKNRSISSDSARKLIIPMSLWDARDDVLSILPVVREIHLWVEYESIIAICFCHFIMIHGFALIMQYVYLNRLDQSGTRSSQYISMTFLSCLEKIPRCLILCWDNLSIRGNVQVMSHACHVSCCQVELSHNHADFVICSHAHKQLRMIEIRTERSWGQTITLISTQTWTFRIPCPTPECWSIVMAAFA